MARILAISSQVARGSIGLSAVLPALQGLGHEVIALPTILLSNHPGHAKFAGEQVSPNLLQRMLDALEGNGWLSGIDAILTGYLPSSEHVALARGTIERLRSKRAGLLYLCDPVIGDDPKGLYIDRLAADAIRRDLVPLAGALTPNRFELSFITGREISTHEAALEALEALGRATLVIAKSLPGGVAAELVNAAAVGGVPLALARVNRRPIAQHGTGDLMAALILAALVEGREATAALAIATAILDRTLAASLGRDELFLGDLPRSLNEGAPWQLESPDGALDGSGWDMDQGSTS